MLMRVWQPHVDEVDNRAFRKCVALYDGLDAATFDDRGNQLAIFPSSGTKIGELEDNRLVRAIECDKEVWPRLPIKVHPSFPSLRISTAATRSIAVWLASA